jgi:rSAM/selenodomain-associated transferase 1
MSVLLTPVVAVFARAPVSGEVKSRLAREIGESAAYQAHLELAKHTLTRLRPVTQNGMFAELWIAGNSGMIKCREWAAMLDGRLRQQHGADIGAAMWNCLYTHVNLGRNAMVVGSDVVSITPEQLLEARDYLMDVDMVISPAEDGGYGMIGLSILAPELFREIPWGTADVFERTMEKAKKLGLSSHVMPMVWDVDNAADFARFKATYPPQPPKAPPWRYASEPPEEPGTAG